MNILMINHWWIKLCVLSEWKPPALPARGIWLMDKAGKGVIPALLLFSVGWTQQWNSASHLKCFLPKLANTFPKKILFQQCCTFSTAKFQLVVLTGCKDEVFCGGGTERGWMLQPWEHSSSGWLWPCWRFPSWLQGVGILKVSSSPNHTLVLKNVGTHAARHQKMGENGGSLVSLANGALCLP